MIAGAAACGVPVVGGHTVKNPEPLFGLAVTGVAHPDRLVLKGGARSGDILVLTKPLGIGVLTTALKNAGLSPEGIVRVTELMLEPNDKAATIMLRHGAHAATDITGFGLLGHALEMARGSRLTIELHWSAIPVLEEALPLAESGVFPGGARNNLKAYLQRVTLDPALAEWQSLLLADPQTSGGLLIAFPPARVDAALSDFAAEGVPARRVGRMLDPGPRDAIVCSADIDTTHQPG